MLIVFALVIAQRFAIRVLFGLQDLLEAVSAFGISDDRSLIEVRDRFPGRLVSDDLNGRKRSGIGSISQGVIEVPVGIHEKADRLIRPFADLIDVFACA